MRLIRDVRPERRWKRCLSQRRYHPTKVAAVLLQGTPLKTGKVEGKNHGRRWRNDGPVNTETMMGFEAPLIVL